jgi:hypothetical protein
VAEKETTTDERHCHQVHQEIKDIEQMNTVENISEHRLSNEEYQVLDKAF